MVQARGSIPLGETKSIKIITMKKELLRHIDDLTNHSLDRQVGFLIYELLDQGYTIEDLREYFWMKHIDALRDIEEIKEKYQNLYETENRQKDYEQKHWENLTAHYERFTDY